MKYRIYQIKDIGGTKYAFMSYDYAVKNGLSLDDYELVYEGEIWRCPEEDLTLEVLFERFNNQHPEDYKSRSMSVSDIVVLEDRKYYCDSFGFKRMA